MHCNTLGRPIGMGIDAQYVLLICCNFSCAAHVSHQIHNISRAFVCNLEPYISPIPLHRHYFHHCFTSFGCTVSSEYMFLCWTQKASISIFSRWSNHRNIALTFLFKRLIVLLITCSHESFRHGKAKKSKFHCEISIVGHCGSHSTLYTH